MNKCNGQIEIAGTNWYNSVDLPNLIYCQFCYENNCIPVELTKLETAAIAWQTCSCNADHDRLKSYLCDDHRNKMFSCDIGKCVSCKCNTFTGKAKYCRSCSAELRRCEFCGKSE